MEHREYCLFVNSTDLYACSTLFHSIFYLRVVWGKCIHIPFTLLWCLEDDIPLCVWRVNFYSIFSWFSFICFKFWVSHTKKYWVRQCFTIGLIDTVKITLLSMFSYKSMIVARVRNKNLVWGYWVASFGHLTLYSDLSEMCHPRNELPPEINNLIYPQDWWKENLYVKMNTFW